jgi:hypothetical protein
LAAIAARLLTDFETFRHVLGNIRVSEMTTDNQGDRGEFAEVERAVEDDFDWQQTAPSTAVVEVVSRALTVESTAIDPLYDVVDPDALDRLVDTETADRSRSDIRIEFVYDGLRVTVESAGTVAVQDDPTS